MVKVKNTKWFCNKAVNRFAKKSSKLFRNRKERRFIKNVKNGT
jgi:hypothetical protein